MLYTPYSGCTGLRVVTSRKKKTPFKQDPSVIQEETILNSSEAVILREIVEITEHTSSHGRGLSSKQLVCISAENMYLN